MIRRFVAKAAHSSAAVQRLCFSQQHSRGVMQTRAGFRAALSQNSTAINQLMLRESPVRSFASTTTSTEFSERSQEFLQFLHNGVADMTESNPEMELELVRKDETITEFKVFVNDEVGTYVFQAEPDTSEIVMISPRTGFVIAHAETVCVFSQTRHQNKLE